MRTKHKLNAVIFIPTFSIIFIAALIGIFNNEALVSVAKSVFYFSLSDFSWLYQLGTVSALIIVGFVFFSPIGKIRLGGADAKPNFSFASNFAIALSGGIATGVVTYSVNEPIILLGNIYGEIAQQGFDPVSAEAAIFAIARTYHNWGFIPYATYSIVGLMIAYMHYNRKEKFSIASTLVPLFGQKVYHPASVAVINIFSVLAIALGLAASLGAGLALISSGIESYYGVPANPITWLVLTLVIATAFILSAVSGLKRGIRILSSVNAYIFYVFLFILLVVGPLAYILSLSTTSLGYWLNNVLLWSFDTKEHGGEALVTWWTMYDWSIWIAYAPLMGLFLARISYGRTIKEFLIINWILPAVFSMVWFAVWGASAIKWQMDGTLDLIQIITDNGAVAGLWAFLQNLPFAFILIPLAIFTLIISFSTAADSMTSTIATICTKNIDADEEAPTYLKIVWGVSIGAIAYVMVAFGGGSQGVDGIKYLAAAGGSMVVILFILILMSAFKLFIYNKDTMTSEALSKPSQKEEL